MTRVVPLALVLAASAAHAQEPADSLQRLPPFSIPIREDFEPPQTSAGRAYLYSAAATGGTVALGYLLYMALPESDLTESSFSANYVGVVVMGLGVVAGPAVGNLSLGAVDDVKRAQAISAAGFLSGAVLVTVSLGAAAGGDPGTVSEGLFVAGVALAGAGYVGGVAYTLATIPRNAARAQRYRQSYPRVAVAPGWRSGGPALSVRVGL